MVAHCRRLCFIRRFEFHDEIAFPSIAKPYYVTIRDRPRVSGLTSVRWISNDRLVCCDFNERAIYLVDRCENGFRFVDVKPTVGASGQPVSTDLCDYHDGRVIVSNFFQGTTSLYRVVGDSIVFEKEVVLNQFKGIHGVRFIPGYSNLVWLSYCGKGNKCLQVVDIDAEKVLWTIHTQEQAQDVAFVGSHALMAARTAHITEGILTERSAAPLKEMYATAYLYKLPDDLRQAPPVLVDSWRGEGHVDAMKEFGPFVLAANQYLNRIDIFSMAGGKIGLVNSIPGFNMPHGLDVNQRNELAVTNYGDQTLRIIQLRVAKSEAALLA